MRFQIILKDNPTIDGVPQCGVCKYQEQIIEIRRGLPRDQMVDTLFHEIVHAVLARTCPLLSRNQDEQVTTGVTSGLLTVFLQNPGLKKLL